MHCNLGVTANVSGAFPRCTLSDLSRQSFTRRLKSPRHLVRTIKNHPLRRIPSHGCHHAIRLRLLLKLRDLARSVSTSRPWRSRKVRSPTSSPAFASLSKLIWIPVIFEVDHLAPLLRKRAALPQRIPPQPIHLHCRGDTIWPTRKWTLAPKILYTNVCVCAA